MVEVLRVAVEPCGLCALDAPLQLEIAFRATGGGALPKAHWELRFVADLVHHQLPVELTLDASESQSESEGERIEILRASSASWQPVLALPQPALESLGLLEARLLADEAPGPARELALVRLVADVRRSGDQVLRGLLDPFK
ncbi:unnamed protein product [Effrenium voratum]|uniref:Uncharacterized protein n=1 Tax=Effrenium voratum TaxID=2562239 RepID=A0AA36MRK1_9DINO|nr:unnamed protein product [Effrenium voratum]